jgi:hypothetical protein
MAANSFTTSARQHRDLEQSGPELGAGLFYLVEIGLWVESGFPSEIATTQKMPERFLLPVYVNPL